jgi:hypothetical protein
MSEYERNLTRKDRLITLSSRAKEMAGKYALKDPSIYRYWKDLQYRFAGLASLL